MGNHQMSGVELAKKIKAINSNIITILCSGDIGIDID